MLRVINKVSKHFLTIVTTFGQRKKTKQLIYVTPILPIFFIFHFDNTT